uniref:Allyl alcohol dehydrogenase n=1 Tax=Solanum tuberosum TaxID=4113 RepID=M1A0U6_SOLTU
MLDEVLLHMNLYGRIAVSGMISQYNLKKPDGIHNLFCLISKRLRIEGFSEFDFRHKVSEYLEFAIQLIREKKLLFVEDIAEGLENAASAFVGIYHGRKLESRLFKFQLSENLKNLGENKKNIVFQSNMLRMLV